MLSNQRNSLETTGIIGVAKLQQICNAVFCLSLVAAVNVTPCHLFVPNSQPAQKCVNSSGLPAELQAYAAGEACLPLSGALGL